MSHFVDCDREQAFLLPPDLRDWIPADDLGHFVIEAVERVDLGAFKVNHRGTGLAQYHPLIRLRGIQNELPGPLGLRSVGQTGVQAADIAQNKTIKTKVLVLFMVFVMKPLTENGAGIWSPSHMPGRSWDPLPSKDRPT